MKKNKSRRKHKTHLSPRRGAPSTQKPVSSSRSSSRRALSQHLPRRTRSSPTNVSSPRRSVRRVRVSSPTQRSRTRRVRVQSPDTIAKLRMHLLSETSLDAIAELLLRAPDELVEEYLSSTLHLSSESAHEIRKEIRTARLAQNASLIAHKLKEYGVSVPSSPSLPQQQSVDTPADRLTENLRAVGQMLALKELEEIKRELELLRREQKLRSSSNRIAKIELRDRDDGVSIHAYDDTMALVFEKVVVMSALGQELATLLRDLVNSMNVGDSLEIHGDNFEKKLEVVANQSIEVSPRGKLDANHIVENGRIVGISLSLSPFESRNIVEHIVKEVEAKPKTLSDSQGAPNTQPSSPPSSPPQPQPASTLVSSSSPPQTSSPQPSPQSTSTSPPQTTSSIDIELMKKYLAGDGITIPKLPSQSQEKKVETTQNQPQPPPSSQPPAAETQKSGEEELSINQLKELLKGI